MTTAEATAPMTAEEIVSLTKRHNIFSWSAQGSLNPIPMVRGEGISFWDANGKRYVDMNSQLMCVNIGHGDRRVIDAIKRQADELVYAGPGMATAVRARLGRMLAERTPGDLNRFFFTLGGAEANENAIRIARTVTGRQKIMVRYRSYHGATAGAISLTGYRFACDRWNVVPDMITMAKGLTSAYLPLGAVAVSDRIAGYYDRNVFYGGLTYNAHPMSLAAAEACLQVMIDDDTMNHVQRVGRVMTELHASMKAKHPSVGDVRSIGLFGVLELVRNRQTKEPMAQV